MAESSYSRRILFIGILGEAKLVLRYLPEDGLILFSVRLVIR